MKSGVIFGVGAWNGLGAQLCRRFSRAGLNILAVGRSEEKLTRLRERVQSEGGALSFEVADVTLEQDVTRVFQRIADLGRLELCVFNVGNNMPGAFIDMSADYFTECWRQNCLGAFLTAREAIKRMLPYNSGTLIFTGASASMRGRPNFAAFAMAKAGLRAMAQSIAKDFGPKGIHVAHVVIDGTINGDRARARRTEIVQAKGDDGLVDLEGLTELYYNLYTQKTTSWTHEVDVRPFKEPF